MNCTSLSYKLAQGNSTLQLFVAAGRRKLTMYRNERPRTLGIDILRDPRTNKGTAFTLRERQLLGIHGLVPPGVLTLDQQVSKMLANMIKLGSDLERYSFLTALQDRNECLFYKLVTDYIEYCMPLIYTPTVGLACQAYGAVMRRPRGLYITIHDTDYIAQIFNNWPEQTVKVIVVTDGERILGLGDLGANGMGIPIGKLSLYSALAGVNPKHCLPVMLDVGTDNEALLADPMYTGVRHRRIRDQRYDELIDHFMRTVQEKYGHDCLIQFEDFANQNAYRLLDRYRDRYCTYNDDIQGTAAVALSGLLAACRITKRPIEDNTYVFVGGGSAASGIAELLCSAIQTHGLSKEEAYRKIFMFDKDGLLVKGRPRGSFTQQNEQFARSDIEPCDSLLDVVTKYKPTAIIGASGQPGLFTTKVIQQMCNNTDRPIIFALSNPTSKSECTAEDAYQISQGKCVFASGSPFGTIDLVINGKPMSFQPGQCNNSYIFPAIGLSIAACQIRPIVEKLFIVAAKSLADQVQQSDLDHGRVFPPLTDIREVSLNIAAKVAEHAFELGLCHLHPQPESMRSYLAERMYKPHYSLSIPDTYEWPAAAFGLETGTPVANKH